MIFLSAGLKQRCFITPKRIRPGRIIQYQKWLMRSRESVVDVLVEKSLKACRKLKVNTLLIGGGVAANSALRRELQAQAVSQGVDVFFPPMALCLDNAAMIAGLAYHWH